jgi:hypothetical protein
MRAKGIWHLAIALVVTGLACESVSGPGDTITRPATLEHFGDGPNLTVPANATVGVPLHVTFTTYGGGCVQRATNTLSVSARVANIRSRQREYIPRQFQACTDELRVEANDVAVTFGSPGTALVRVFGRAMPGATPLTLERQVIVTR